MSTPVLVLGESGSGKSASLRNLDPVKTLLIQAIPKRLPFKQTTWHPLDLDKGTGNIIVTDKSVEICQLMQRTKRKIIVLDDYQYILANEFMRRADERGFDKFTEIGRHAWDILVMAAALPSDVRVYIMAHTDVNEDGRIRTKTIGKLLNEKITVEGMFTVVLRTIARDGEYFFSTQTSGFDPVKTPMGMFPEPLIENDLAVVDKAITDYGW
jgi:hypothetical protein